MSNPPKKCQTPREAVKLRKKSSSRKMSNFEIKVKLRKNVIPRKNIKLRKKVKPSSRKCQTLEKK